MIHVLLVDDHASFRGALGFMVDHEPDIKLAGEAGSIAEAHEIVHHVDDIDIAFIDLDLPDGNGLDVLPDLYGRHPSAAAVVLSGSIRPESRALAIAAGAVGFLPKTAGVSEIINAIRKLTNGESLLTPAEAMTLLRQASQYQARTRGMHEALTSLTPREMDVLRALASGLDNQAIADQLSLSTATVRSHVVHVLQKLQVDSRLQAALIAVRHGIAGQEETI